MTLEELIKQATPLPWPVDWTEPENPEGTTIAESHANDQLKRHSANILPKLVVALDDFLNHDCPETGQCGVENALDNGFTYFCWFRRRLADVQDEANNPPEP